MELIRNIAARLLSAIDVATVGPVVRISRSMILDHLVDRVTRLARYRARCMTCTFGQACASERATRAFPGSGPGGAHSPLLAASGRLAPMPIMPGYSRPMDEAMFLLLERWADSTAWGVDARANDAGDDGSRGDLRPDHATRGLSRPRISRRSPSSTAHLRSARAAPPCAGERVR